MVEASTLRPDLKQSPLFTRNLQIKPSEGPKSDAAEQRCRNAETNLAALRLVLTMIAGGALGFNRGIRGEAARLRTTILVGLAASVAMIQANILLPVGGTADCFGVMDLPRFHSAFLLALGSSATPYYIKAR